MTAGELELGHDDLRDGAAQGAVWTRQGGVCHGGSALCGCQGDGKEVKMWKSRCLGVSEKRKWPDSYARVISGGKFSPVFLARPQGMERE